MIERLLGIDPRPVPPHVFLLSEGALRYGRFVREESGFEVEDFAISELPAELFAAGPLGGTLHDPGLFKPRIEEIVAEIEGGVGEASLVLPDAWLRLSFAEMDELPPRGERRLEALRWKLKRQVPFPVADLRIRAVPVEPLPGQEASARVLVGYAIEALLAQLEAAFDACDIHVGQILNASLASAGAVAEVTGALELSALVLTAANGYGLTFLQRGEPVLHRFRALDSGVDDQAAADLVRRDLRLTASFIADQLPGRDLQRVLLVSADHQRDFWLAQLERALGVTPVAIGREQLPLRGRLPEVAPVELASMVGAALREVA